MHCISLLFIHSTNITKQSAASSQDCKDEFPALVRERSTPTEGSRKGGSTKKVLAVQEEVRRPPGLKITAFESGLTKVFILLGSQCSRASPVLLQMKHVNMSTYISMVLGPFLHNCRTLALLLEPPGNYWEP